MVYDMIFTAETCWYTCLLIALYCTRVPQQSVSCVFFLFFCSSKESWKVRDISMATGARVVMLFIKYYSSAHVSVVRFSPRYHEEVAWGLFCVVVVGVTVGLQDV